MKEKIIPIYNIDQFHYLGTERGFYANALSAHLAQHEHIILAPHKHDFFLCVLVTKGYGAHEIDFNTYSVKPGCLFMLFPGQVHTWNLSADIDGYILFHTKEFYNLNFTHEKIENYPFFNSINNSPLLILKDENFDKVRAIFQEIIEEYKKSELMKFQKLCSLKNVLYIELSRLYLPEKIRQKQNENYLSKLRRLEELINTHFKKIKSPKDYARMMNVSEKHLNRICKECLNITTSELISNRIILEAKRMLMHSKYSVSEIAAELGYFENSYFFRLFKKKTGNTPMEFSNKLKEN